MRILLANYQRNSTAPVDINKLDNSPAANSRAWFDEWAGVEASALDDATIERLRPGVYRCMAREEQDTIYMKVHDAWSRTKRGDGLFPVDVTGGVIYILRNPLDMVASCANHWGISLEQAVENLCDQDYKLAGSLGGISDQLCQRVGSWSGHVKSWLEESGLPVKLVRYEDLKHDPQRVFGEVARFCGLPFDEERVSQAVAFSDFSELQRQEKSNDFRERPPLALGAFFRKGQTGSWREELPAHLVQRLIETHAATMRRFGYLNENNQPI